MVVRGKQADNKLDRSYFYIAKNYLAVTKVIQNINGIKLHTPSTPQGWTKPEKGVIKVNVDGAIKFESQLSSVCITAKTSDGLACECMKVRLGFYSPLVIELKAIWNGLLLVESKQWSIVSIKTHF